MHYKAYSEPLFKILKWSDKYQESYSQLKMEKRGSNLCFHQILRGKHPFCVTME